MKWLCLFCKRSAGWLRGTYEHLLSHYLSLCFLHTHSLKKCVSVWACAQQRERERESASLNHPVDSVQKKILCVCVWSKTVAISRLESLPLGFSLSTVSHRALTSEDRDSPATGSPSLQNPQLINYDCFLCVSEITKQVWEQWFSETGKTSVSVHCITISPLSKAPFRHEMYNIASFSYLLKWWPFVIQTKVSVT